MSNIILIPPLQFAHVLNLNTNITSLVVGPQRLVLQSNESLVAGPLPMVIVPPGHYCVIKNPCSHYEEGKQSILKHGHQDVRFHQEPFPLYPGEELSDAPDFLNGRIATASLRAMKPLPVVPPNHAVRLTARVDHMDGSVLRKAGDTWQIEGPLTYKPSPDVESIRIHKPRIIHTGEALRLQAQQDFIDRNGKKRITGEEWIVTEVGAYLTEVYEQVIETISAYTLTQDEGLHLRAIQTLTDCFGKVRQAGEEWLITAQDTESYVPEIGVEMVKHVRKTVLTTGQYCVILDPYDAATGQNQMGRKSLRIGVCSFFLHPGEQICSGIEQAHVLQADEAIVLQASEQFTDKSGSGSVKREPGDKWMIRGPLQYIPPVHVKVLFLRKSIPLCKNEGIYVRNLKTGNVRAVMGPQSYMLTEHEEEWQKQLPDLVETLLKKGGGLGSEDIRKVAYFEQSIDSNILKGRVKTKLVTYRCPPNTACQVYNHIKKTARVVFGPDLVVLGPHENFNVLSLSAGKPKRADALKSLCLMLGPDYITDIIQVETSDHARLQIKLAFNNYFEVDKTDATAAEKIFSVPDFIGFACQQIGSKIRVSVAQITFDEFHKHSSKVIQHAVFGQNADGKLNSTLHFEANNLVITSVDVQSIEPVDVKMRDSLAKSVQMAIEIATNSIEASASHEAQRLEQAARGHLERQKILNEKEAEKERSSLCELQAVTAAVESCGQAKAEAQAQAERLLIECHSEIEVARLKAEATDIEHSSYLDTHYKKQYAGLSFVKECDELEIEKAKALADIETNKFSEMISALGTSTIAAIAASGPQTKINMLEGLGLKSTLITSGNSPVNLFMTAEGLVKQPN